MNIIGISYGYVAVVFAFLLVLVKQQVYVNIMKATNPYLSKINITVLKTNQSLCRQISPGEERGVGCEEQSGRRTMPTKIGGGIFFNILWSIFQHLAIVHLKLEVVIISFYRFL